MAKANPSDVRTNKMGYVVGESVGALQTILKNEGLVVKVKVEVTYVPLTSAPSDWSTKYTSYYTKTADGYSPVTGDTAPQWEANKYYKKEN